MELYRELGWPKYVRVTPPKEKKYPWESLKNVGDSFLVTRTHYSDVRARLRKQEKTDGRKYVCERQYIGVRVFRVE